jgi:hypothetical protein
MSCANSLQLNSLFWAFRQLYFGSHSGKELILLERGPLQILDLTILSTNNTYC